MHLPVRKLTPARVGRHLRGRWQDFARRAEYRAEISRFLAGPREQFDLRRQLLASFLYISIKVPCSHAESDILRIADFILRLPRDLPGDIVESGVFKGGASCKLSLVAAATGRRLILCDSFHGFPKDADKEDARLSEGEKLGTLDEVRHNVSLHGDPSVVEYVPGWLQHTLPELRATGRPLVTVFEDTDLYDPATVCIKVLYPMLQPGGRIFTHDVMFPAALAAYRDKKVWSGVAINTPPKLVIVRKAIFRRTGSLGYVGKPRAREQVRVGA